jgi:hypothetical protein
MTRNQIMLAICLLGQSFGSMYAATTTGAITNNSNTSVNVVFYKGFVPATDKKSAQGRIGTQGTVITAGQNYNFPDSSINSIEVFYGNGTLPPLRIPVNTNSNYTINPGAQWTVTQD